MLIDYLLLLFIMVGIVINVSKIKAKQMLNLCKVLIFSII